MCGIAVLFSTSGKSVDPTHLYAMTEALVHRGPDDWGWVFFDRSGKTGGLTQEKGKSIGIGSPPTVGLGHRRLSIIDLSPNGRQPMSYDDGRLWIVYNGEVYNYAELRRELAGRGYRFTSDSDTEVILASYHAWGPDCVTRFNGMWAFAVFDTRNRSLFLSRDRLGVKPLYFTERDGVFIASSEIRGILATGLIPEVNDAVVYDYLASGYVDHTRETFYRGIFAVGAGTNMTVTDENRTKTWRYWRIQRPLDPHDPAARDSRASERLREILFDSVRLRLISDVPVGTCLSGGLDSSSLAAVISRLIEEGAGTNDRKRIIDAVGTRQRVFSACYADKKADESPFSELVAERTGAIQYKVFPTADEFWRDLASLIETQGEPFGGTSIYAQYRVMELVKRQGVKVLLDGQGSDEILAGYPGYRGRYLNDLARRMRIFRFLSEAAGSGMGPGERKTALLVALYLLLPKSLRRRVGGSLRDEGPRYLSRELKEKYRGRNEEIAGMGESDRLNDQLVVDTTVRSLPALLRYEDRNSMAFSVESRVPFLDYRLVEFAASLPEELKVRNGYTKWVLRNAVQPLLPEQVVWRKDKKGFVTPQEEWLSTGKDVIRECIFGSPDLAEYLDTRRVGRYVNVFSSGKKGDTNLVWRWLNLALWKAGTAKSVTGPS